MDILVQYKLRSGQVITIKPVIPDYYTVITMSVNTIKANGITSHYSTVVVQMCPTEEGQNS